MRYFGLYKFLIFRVYKNRNPLELSEKIRDKNTEFIILICKEEKGSDYCY